MATIDDDGNPIIACGPEGKVYLCSDLKQVQKGSVYEIRKKSDNTLVDTVALKHPDIEEEVV